MAPTLEEAEEKTTIEAVGRHSTKNGAANMASFVSFKADGSKHSQRNRQTTSPPGRYRNDRIGQEARQVFSLCMPANLLRATTILRFACRHDAARCLLIPSTTFAAFTLLQQVYALRLAQNGTTVVQLTSF